MNIFTNRADARHQKMNEANDHSQYLAHADEPEDLNRKYEGDGITHLNNLKSSRNLFDDSDTNEKYWLYVAKRYLRKYRV